MQTLNRESPMPLWAQLEAALRARIADGEFRDRFPTDAELVRTYDVSRHTARVAIGKLQAAGLVERERGRGSHLPPAAEFEQSVSSLYSLAVSISEQGMEEHSLVQHKEVERDAEAADRLGVPRTEEFVHIRRLRFAGEEPLALDESWIIAQPGRPLLSADLERGSLYELLARLANVRITGGSERIRAAIPDETVRTLLALPKGEAILVAERIALAGERPIEYRRSRIRGDRFAFLANWTRAR